MYAKTAIFAVAGLMLAACGSPQDYESAPVEVATKNGVVTCQLYTRSQVLWDRSINRPHNMSVETADQVCRNEGYRILGRTS